MTKRERTYNTPQKFLQKGKPLVGRTQEGWEAAEVHGRGALPPRRPGAGWLTRDRRIGRPAYTCQSAALAMESQYCLFSARPQTQALKLLVTRRGIVCDSQKEIPPCQLVNSIQRLAKCHEAIGRIRCLTTRTDQNREHSGSIPCPQSVSCVRRCVSAPGPHWGPGNLPCKEPTASA